MIAHTKRRLFDALYSHRVVLKRVLAVGFAILVLSMLTFAVLKVDWHSVFEALKALPVRSLSLAAGLAIITYCVYSCFDLLGRFYTGHRLARWRTMLVGYISYAFTMSLGSTIGGVGLRMRLYAKQGLKQSDILRIWGISVTTNWMGYLVMAGVVLITGQINLPATWGPGSEALRIVGVLCLGIVLVYLWASAFSKRRSWTVRGHTIDFPDVRLALIQCGLGMLGWALLAAIPYTLFQNSIPYVEILGIVLISAVAGLIARIPGGLGVIEYVFMTMLAPAIPRHETLAVVLVYRLFYYIGPLLIAGLAYLIAEARLKAVS